MAMADGGSLPFFLTALSKRVLLTQLLPEGSFSRLLLWGGGGMQAAARLVLKASWTDLWIS